MSAMASQITSITMVYSTVYSGAVQRKHQRSASLAFVREIHRRPVNSLHKRPVTQKMFSFDDVIMDLFYRYCVCRNRKRWESSGGIGVAPRYHRPTEVERRRRKYFGNRSRETHWKLCSCHDQLFQTYLVTGWEIHLLNSLCRILCFIELNVNLNESW